VFGHVHVAHLVAGDRYVNAGALLGETLSYLAVDGRGSRLGRLTLQDAAASDGFAPEMG
jgi:hypothetical protein